MLVDENHSDLVPPQQNRAGRFVVLCNSTTNMLETLPLRTRVNPRSRPAAVNFSDLHRVLHSATNRSRGIRMPS